MSEIAKSFRFRVALPGSTTVDSNVDWQETAGEDEGRISGFGEIGGQIVHPLRGGTTARPWSVTITDVDEVITARLADTDGRAHLLRRLADFSVSTDGGATWTVKATARIDDVVMTSDLAGFQFTMQDERLIERKTTIFKAGNSTHLLPPGLGAAWLDFQAAGAQSFQVNVVDSGADTTQYVHAGEAGNPDTDYFERVDADFLRILEEDVVDDPGDAQGNFETLRVNINGTDREIVSLNSSPSTRPIKVLQDRRTFSHFLVAGFADAEGFIRQCYFHMPGRDPSPELPLHIGGQAGIDPFTLVKNIYDGDYQDDSVSPPATVRYDTERFSAYDPTTNPEGLIDNPRFPKMHFRITGPENMAKWLDDNIYGPLGVTPFINEDGEVSPRLSRLPASDQLPDPVYLFEFSKSNTAGPAPGWGNRGRELVTVCEIEFEYAVAPVFELVLGRPSGFLGLPSSITKVPLPGGETSTFDLLTEKTQVLSHDHDRAVYHRETHKRTVRGIHREFARKKFARQYSADTFDLFGDGPVYTDVVGMSDADGVEAGDHAVLDLDSYPALQNQSRSGQRILQVLAKVEVAAGPMFECMELGPSLQPLTVPTITLSANSNDDHNAVDVQVSGLASGEGHEVHMAVAASEPAEGADDWQYLTIRGDANETFTVRDLPSGSTIWGRVRATAPNRIRSDWSTADSQATTALTAPSGLADISVAGDEATVQWVNGEADYDIVIELDGSFIARLPAGTTQYRFWDLDTSTGYTAGVKHVDDFGGESSTDTDGFTTTGTPTTLNRPYLLRVLAGGRV